MGQVNTASELFDTLTICDEHRIEVLELFNFPQGLTFKQDGLALITRDECWHHPDRQCMYSHTNP